MATTTSHHQYATLKTQIFSSSVFFFLMKKTFSNMAFELPGFKHVFKLFFCKSDKQIAGFWKRETVEKEKD